MGDLLLICKSHSNACYSVPDSKYLEKSRRYVTLSFASARVVLEMVAQSYIAGPWSIWFLTQSATLVAATIAHILCLIFAKLNPVWTLMFYLLSCMGLVGSATFLSFKHSAYFIYESLYDPGRWNSSHEESSYVELNGKIVTAVTLLVWLGL